MSKLSFGSVATKHRSPISKDRIREILLTLKHKYNEVIQRNRIEYVIKGNDPEEDILITRDACEYMLGDEIYNFK